MKQAHHVIVALLSVAGCSALEPDVGPLMQELCVNEDSDPSTDISFSRDILGTLFTQNGGGCLTCHVPGEVGEQSSGLDLSTYETALTGGRSGDDNIIAGSPCESILWQKVSPAPPFGARMPLSRPPLTDSQITMLRDWIAEGALKN